MTTLTMRDGSLATSLLTKLEKFFKFTTKDTMNLSFLKKTGHILEEVGVAVGPTAASIFLGPAAGALVNTAIQSIEAAAHTNATGPEKKAAVMATLETVAPQVGTILASAGIPVKDQPKFATGVDQFVEALLNMLKATGAVPSNPAPVQVAPSATVSSVPTDVTTGGYKVSEDSVVMTKNMDKAVVVYVRGVDPVAIVG